MKFTKPIWFQGRNLNQVAPYQKRWSIKWMVYKIKRAIRWTIKWTAITASISAILIGAGAYGIWAYPRTVEAEPIKVEVDSPAVIMDKIAKCESNSSQFDKNGQVLINKTQDMGKYQINVPIWGKKASELGFNLSTEEGNTKMGYWLYKNKGTEPWVHSKNCWNK